MACIRKNKLGKGVSYTIQVKVKDNKLNKYVTKYLTWKKPNTMTDYQAKREVDKLAFEFESKVRKQMSGMLCKDNDKTFEEYATEWLARAKKNKSPTYYVRTRALIVTMKEYFGKIKLKDITPSLIQCFIDKIQDHKVVYEYAVMKKDIKNHLLSNHIKPKNLKKITGVGDYTYQASRRNEHVRVESAKNLCKGLGIDFNEYYDVVRESHPYAKESILKYKRCLSAMLANAKRQQLIEQNYASSEYILPVSGSKKEIEILSDEEVKIFQKELDNEPNIRWKISMYILLYMGLRRGELAGLEWKDIDFDKKTMSIERSSYYLPEYGLITKDPKTYTSRRVLTMPDCLIEELKKYQEWYLRVKEIFGETWEKCDRVMISDEGNPINPSIYRAWLNKILKRANLKHVTLHSLRHTNITLQISAGVDLKTVSVRAGHARTSTTSDIYSHFIKSSDTHASKILDEIFTANKNEIKDEKKI